MFPNLLKLVRPTFPVGILNPKAEDLVSMAGLILSFSIGPLLPSPPL